MNTDKLLTTLQAPPCNWRIMESAIGWVGQSRDAIPSTCQIRDNSVTMQCVFAPDMPAQVAARNLNYLLTVALVLGGNGAYNRLLRRVRDANRVRQDQRYEWTDNDAQFVLDVSFTNSTTTLEVKERAE